MSHVGAEPPPYMAAGEALALDLKLLTIPGCTQPGTAGGHECLWLIRTE